MPSTQHGAAPYPVDTIRAEFPGARGYLDTATCGLPPQATVRALHAHLAEWSGGSGGPVPWDEPVQRARAAFARLVGARRDQVAIGATVAGFVGMVAASLPPGAEVLCAAEDFTSVLWPFAAQRNRGIRVRTAPLDLLAAAIGPETAWVAVSAVQSATGAVADLAALRAAADGVDARLLVDVTQSAGWLPVRPDQCDVLVAGAYKWLLAPRGAAFAVFADRVLDAVVPTCANWYAGESMADSFYGLPMRLAPTAQRFDTSPSWVAWAGAAVSLEVLAGLDRDLVHQHDVRLANYFRSLVGLPPGNSAIVSMSAAPDAAEFLARAGVRCAARDGRLRFAFHLYNDGSDAEAAAEVLRDRRHLRAPEGAQLATVSPR